MDTRQKIIIGAIIIFVLAFFLGWLFRKLLSERKVNGTLVIEKQDDRDVFRWIFNDELEDFQNKKKLIIKVENSKN